METTPLSAGDHEPHGGRLDGSGALVDHDVPAEHSWAGGVCSADTFTNTLCQQSWNPGFGNTDFDPDAEGTYHLRLVLLPDTFSGPPLAVAIQINVED
jgi:hypothetical protein